jgi:hypothetical protein
MPKLLHIDNVTYAVPYLLYYFVFIEIHFLFTIYALPAMPSREPFN